MKYLQLRDSEIKSELELENFVDDETVLSVAYALFTAWFPRFPEYGPFGEDLENWKAIAVEDAQVAIGRLRDLGLLSQIDGAMVSNASPNDE